MRIPATATVAALLLVGSSWLNAQDPKDAPAAADAPAPFPDGYLDHDGLSAALKRVADSHPKAVRLRSLARTGEGRDVWMATVGREAAEGEAPRPAVLIVANLEADHLVGSHVALGLVERLATADGDAGKRLEALTYYIVPRLNPDGAERFLKEPRFPLRTNLRPVDRDRDRQAGEDGPDDLDGDGLATTLRVKDDKATLVPDAKDARILRRADATKGERPVYSEYAEGKDDDGDGRLNEDPPGGVNLNRNWPYRWTEFDPETGTGAASEPEVRALIAFAFEHPEIVAVWSFSLNDNLRAEPKKPGSTLDDADLPYFAELSRLHAQAAKKDGGPEKAQGADEPEKKKEAEPPAPKAEDQPKSEEPAKTAPPAEPAKKGQRPRGGVPGRDRPGGGGAPTAPAAAGGAGLDGTTDGALSEWAYHQFGAVGLASRPWPGPDLPEPAKGEPAPPADGEARWLLWNDKVMGGRAFVPFHEIDHPTLGKVEVGGWKPGVRLNPPSGRIDDLADAEFAFLQALAEKLPRLALEDVKVESKGVGLFEIKATVLNAGYLPTALAQGVRTRKAPPVLVRLKPGEAKLLVGRPLEKIESLAGSASARRDYRWLVLAPEGVRSVTLEASSPKAGRVVREIELK